MAFNLYRENRLEVLAERFVEKVYRASGNMGGLLESFTVVVQTRGMAEYLKQYIAKVCGIAANIQMPFLNSFLNDLFRRIYGDAYSEASYRSSQESMRKELMKLLGDPRYVQEQLPQLWKYISGTNSELKRWQLADKLADIFDQYMLYRSDALADGRLFTSLVWQEKLFNKLFDSEHPGRDVFLEKMRREGVGRYVDKLPRQISIFGVGALPPVYLDIFVQLSEHCEVNFFYLSPCLEYWEYQLSSQERRREAWSVDEAGNPILQALGRQGRGFFTALLANENIAPDWEPSFKEPDDEPGNTMLEVMQHDILHLFDRGTSGDPLFTGRKLAELKNDRTIAIHNCHSVRRELEVLHDELLKLISSKQVDPQNVIVMAPDIVAIAPMIHAVFGKGELRNVYSIADLPDENEALVYETFHRILQTASGRFEYSEVMSLLELAPVSEALGIAADELQRIGKWLQESGVRWGYDRNMREKFCGASFDEYSWQMSMDRLLAGFACRGSGGVAPLLGEVKTLAVLEDADIELFARVVRFLDDLAGLSKLIVQKNDFEQWCRIFTDVTDRFLSSGNRLRTAMAPMRRALDAVKALSRDGYLTGYYPLNAALSILDSYWDCSGENGRFLRGKITFCRMVPMRSIPMDVVAVLELNEGNYPRRSTGTDFDLISINAKQGDRSQAVQDRYLLLEALMAARKQILFFYQGRSSRNNKEAPMCAPLSEIYSYLKNAFDLEEYKHKLSGMDAEYFTADAAYPSLDRENYLAAAALMEARENALDASAKTAEYPEFAGLDCSQTLSIDELVKFFSEPCQWMVRKQLGVYWSSNDPVEDSEPMQLEKIDHWKIDTMISEAGNIGHDQIMRHAMRSNLLPPGAVGKKEFEARAAVVGEMPERWKDMLQDMFRMPVTCRIGIGETTCSISGMINMSADMSRSLVCRMSSYKAKAALPALFGTLTAAVMLDTPVTGEILTLDSGKFVQRIVGPVTPDDARKKLGELLQFAMQKRKLPPPLFQKSSPFYYDSGVAQSKFYKFINDELSGDCAERSVALFYDRDDWYDENFKKQFTEYAELLYGLISIQGA